MKPLDPRLLREARATAGYLILVVALAIFATAATVTIAYALANFVVSTLAAGALGSKEVSWLQLALLAGAIRAAIHFFQEWAGFYAAGRVKLALREKALNKIEFGGGELVSRYGSAELTALLGPGLDALDVYFAKYLPQLVFTALVTPLLTLLIWFFDPSSGITVLLTLPLIPLFMVMIGYVTRDLQNKQLESLERLNGHFLEVIKGLVTLKIFNRIAHQREVLREVSDQYRVRTIKVLRLSFLSGFALELAASLSVALLAVSIGIRLVDGQLGLFVGLFILIIAPEVYLPLRNVGAQFHAAAGGVAVSTKVLDLIEDSLSTDIGDHPEIETGFTVIVGPSGIGKSKTLKALSQGSAVWMPQSNMLLPGTIGSNIYGDEAPNQSLLNQAIELAQIQDLALSQSVSEASLSGGQRQRVCLARALYRLLLTESKLLLLDEPTSQLDSRTAELVIGSLMQIAKSGVSVVVVSHSEAMIGVADRVIKIG